MRRREARILGLGFGGGDLVGGSPGSVMPPTGERVAVPSRLPQAEVYGVGVGVGAEPVGAGACEAEQLEFALFMAFSRPEALGLIAAAI